MSLWTMLESTGTLEAPTIGRDASQGVTQTTWTEVLCDFPCSVQQSGGSRMAFYAQMSPSIGTTVYTATDIGAQPNQRMIITDRTGDSKYYNVNAMTQSVGRGRLWQTECTLIGEPSDA